jgi:hypothetical protein
LSRGANCRHLPSSPPLFGALARYFIVHDELTQFGATVLLVIAGLFLVNRSSSIVAIQTDPLLDVTKT